MEAIRNVDGIDTGEDSDVPLRFELVAHSYVIPVTSVRTFTGSNINYIYFQPQSRQLFSQIIGNLYEYDDHGRDPDIVLSVLTHDHLI
jgi:hypothetical protein